MPPTDYAQHGSGVAEAFQKYLKTGNNDLIKDYSSKELRAAISRLSPYYNNNKQWYREIERRILELNSLEERKPSNEPQDLSAWIGKIIPFVIGLLLGILLF